MVDNMDINKLTEYRYKINNNVVERVKESVTKLNEAMAMLTDLQNINEVLVTSLSEAEQENQSLAKDIIVLKSEIESMKETVKNAEEKEKKFTDMDLSMEKVSALLASLEEREKKKSIAENELVQDRENFEQEKLSIISARLEAEEKADRYLQDKNDAISSRDVAIVDRDKAFEIRKKAEEEKLKAEKELAELREELAEYSNTSTRDEKKLKETIELMEWYRNYAIAVDHKIIDFFRNKNEELYGHYHTFLNNPEKLEEIHIHFPDYMVEEESNELRDYKKFESMVEHKEVFLSENINVDNNNVLEEKVKKKDKKDKKSDRPEFLD